MNSIRAHLKIFLAAFVGVVVLGTIGFALIEGRGLVDAFYFTIVTVSTVGYGDVHPATGAGKLLAVALIVTGVGAFLGVIAKATEMMLDRRQSLDRLDKMNMIIGVFFSELGTRLMAALSDYDPDLDMIKKDLVVTDVWHEGDFERVHDKLKGYKYGIDAKLMDLEYLSNMLRASRGQLVRLLENPTLHEHESFTGLLRAVFHLAEEFSYRGDLSGLPDSDRLHLAGDAKRAYPLLVFQWLDHMRFLKDNYPYLFALAMRTNPFDQEASPIVG